MTSRTKLYTRFRTPRTNESTDTIQKINLVTLDVDFSHLSIDNSQYQVKNFAKDEINECVDYITSGIIDVYLFISNETIDIVLQLMNAFKYFPSIYTFCKDEQSRKYTDKKRNFKGTYKDINMMFEQFQKDINELKNEFYSKQTHYRSSNEESKEMTWWKFLHEILQHIHHTNIAKDEFTAVCREFYAGGQHELKQIEEFEETYSSNQVIHWYTRDSFFYRILNKILRMKDLNNIFKLRLILTDLVSELKIEQLDCHYLIDHPQLLYRGQQMHMEEIQKMKSNIGHSAVVASFLSTSMEKQIALIFLLGSSNDSSMENVLFSIEIDSYNIHNTTTPFADISALSEFPEEKEVLFSANSAFRIQSVQLNEDGIWYIHMTLIDHSLDTDFGERSIFIPHADQIFIRHLAKENKQFIAFQLLMDMLLRLDQNKYAKDELLLFCRSKYSYNLTELRKIDDFEESYRSEDAAKWYTRDSFLYRLLNESLRIETIDPIVKMRYYIHDLHNQLAQLQPSFIQSLNGEKNLTLYRGQTMKINELNEIRENFDGFISMNSFVSATQNKEVAFMFSGDGITTNPDEEVSVIYEMAIDTDIRSTPYATIKSFMDNEEEILISMGPIFRIGEVNKEPDHDGVYNIKLRMEHIEDELWNKLTNNLD
jgi:hypothetical protein